MTFATQLTTRSALRTLALGSLVCLGACSKENTDPAPATGFGWTVDNTDYTDTTATATTQGLLISLMGLSSGNDNHVINITVPAATGTYNTADNTTSAYYYMSYSI